jgi:hypothetical protein
MSWTVETLKEHFDDLLCEIDKRYKQRFDGQEKALDVASDERDKKDAELNDVRLRFISREVFEAYVANQSKKARATIITFVLMGLTIVGLVVQILRG